MDFLLGAVIIVLPKQHQIPLVITTTAIKTIQGALKSRKEKRRQQDATTDTSSSSSSNPGQDGVTLQWSCLSCTLTDKHGNQHPLLQNINGSAKPGRLLAICGPSGSGKTTLLNSISMHLPYSPNLSLQGIITANDIPMPAPGVQFGFVAQEDVFYSQMTVRETLNFAAELRTGRGKNSNNSTNSSEERQAVVDTIISTLGLSKCADTIVGDSKTRGISGGEKKRLAIGIELIARPNLLLLDEPTTGLDAFAAEKVMMALKSLATQDGKTVVCSIHQPRSSIFQLFDDLCLMSDGRLIYHGPTEQALGYFSGIGHVCPAHYNPAEFLADLVSVDHSSPESEKETRERLDALVLAWELKTKEEEVGEVGEEEGRGGRRRGGEVHTTTTSTTTTITTDNRPPSPLTALPPPPIPPPPSIGMPRQFALLFKRSWRQVTRDKATNISRAMSQISSALVFSTIYWRLGTSHANIQDRVGLLQVSAVGTAMSSLIKTLSVFPRERTIVARERGRSPYPVLPYFLSKLAAELPIGAVFPALFAALVYPTTGLRGSPRAFCRFLGMMTLESFSSQALGLAVGAAAPSTEAALAAGPAVILVSIVFGGLFVQSVPKGLAWLPKTSLIRASFTGLCVNEFRGSGIEFQNSNSNSKNGGGGGGGILTGEDVLRRMDFDKETIVGSCGQQTKIMIFYWWCALCILRSKRTKYQPLEPPQ